LAFCIGLGLWGFICLSVGRKILTEDDNIIVEAVELIASMLTLSFPFVLKCFCTQDNEKDFPKLQMMALMILTGAFYTVLFSSPLLFILWSLKVKTFLGIPCFFQ
jgi:hypothetical protein